MNSIKSFAILTLLAIISLFLYWKISEKEVELPPDAMDLAFEAPQIQEFGPGMDYQASPSPGSTAGPTSISSYGSSTAESIAPAWDPSMAAVPEVVPPPENTETSSATNPFDRAGSRSRSLPGTEPPAPTATSDGQAQVLPIARPSLPPGAMTNDSPREIREGRVYEDLPAELPPPIDPAAGPAAEPMPAGNPPVTTPTEPIPAPQGTDAYLDSNPQVHANSTAAPHPSIAPEPGPEADAMASVPPISSGNPADLAAPAGLPAPQAPSAPATDSDPVTPFTITRTTVQELLAKGNYAQALRFLSDYYSEPSLSPDEQREVTMLVSQLAGTVIYSTQHVLESPYYVQQGETLDIIASRFGVPPELLAKINGIADPKAIPPGTELKVVRGPFSAIVDLTRKEMKLMLDGHYAGRFQIGIGSDASNLEGIWTVTTKETNPAYQGSNQSIAGGDPTNPLGDRMLVLYPHSDNHQVAPIGIHGSTATSGLDDPRGFIRLSAADVADVFDILSLGSQVIVRK